MTGRERSAFHVLEISLCFNDLNLFAHDLQDRCIRLLVLCRCRVVYIYLCLCLLSKELFVDMCWSWFRFCDRNNVVYCVLWISLLVVLPLSTPSRDSTLSWLCILQPRVCGRDEETRVLFPSSGRFCWEISTSTRTRLGFSSRRKLKSENFVGVTATAALSDTKQLNFVVNL